VPRAGTGRSNVTHTVTIVDALLRIAAGEERPGTYDLVSFPAWSWRDVLAFEADQAGVPLRLQEGNLEAPAGPMGRVRRAAATVLASPRTREAGLSLIAHLPESFNLRLQAQHFRRRAAAEIGALRAIPVSHAAFTFPDMEVKTLVSLTPTRSLLEAGQGSVGRPEGGALRTP
jgi:hypothetical protein